MPPKKAPDTLSLKQILAALTVPQLWGLIGAIAGLLAGTFVLGYTIHSSLQSSLVERATTSASAATERADAAAAQLASVTADTNELKYKERFLALYLRYELAKAAEDMLASANARKALDEFVSAHTDKDNLTLRKGSGRLATVRFADGTSWELPRELHVVEAK